MVSDCWDYFDRVYCISIDTREDRRAEARAQFEKVGLSGRVEFVVGKKHPADSEQGIYESHMACIGKGISAEAQTILIFEDDVVFDRFEADRLREAVAFLSTNPWDVLFFGCLVGKIRKTSCHSVVRIRCRCLAHAYVLHRGFAETLVKTEWNGTPFDNYLASFEDKMYMMFPSFAFQNDSASDNEKCARLDKVRRFFGGFQRIQKRNEFCYYHEPVMIVLNILMILIIGGILWWLL